MFQSVWVNALFAGMVSACSMPLGSLTTLVWTPKNRALAFLMAFGGGALLSASLLSLTSTELPEKEIYQDKCISAKTLS